MQVRGRETTTKYALVQVSRPGRQKPEAFTATAAQTRAVHSRLCNDDMSDGRPRPTLIRRLGDLGLLGVQLKTEGLEPVSNSATQFLGLLPVVTMSDNVVSVAFPRGARELPGHPRVERIVHEQVGQDGRNWRPLWGPFPPWCKGPVRHLHGGF